MYSMWNTNKIMEYLTKTGILFTDSTVTTENTKREIKKILKERKMTTKSNNATLKSNGKNPYDTTTSLGQPMYIGSTSGSQQYYNSGTGHISWAESFGTGGTDISNNFFSSKRDYTVGLYDIIFRGNYPQKENSAVTTDAIRHAMNKIFIESEMKGTLLAEKPMRLLTEMLKVVTYEEYRKDERESPLIGSRETKQEFQNEQNMLNSILNAFTTPTRNLIYVFNVNERAMLVPGLTEISRMIAYIESDNKGDQSIGQELLRNFACYK